MCMYFQNDRIIVRTDYPIMKILAKPDLVRRMIKWAVELSKFQIQYHPRGIIISQTLANFTTKFSPRPTEEGSAQWTLHVDGSSNSRYVVHG